MKTPFAIVILIIAVAAIALLISKNKKLTTTQTDSATPVNSAQTSGESLKSEDIKVGDGQAAKTGNTVSVQYTGKLTDGTKFDSTADHGGQPFEFVLGQGQVIPGWDQGVAGMKVGGERKLTIPPALAYGAQATGSIPANSTLVFDIQLVGVK